MRQTTLILLTALAIIGRIMPHPANVSPLTSMAIFSGMKYRGISAYLCTLFAYFISNFLLSYLYHIEFWGNWLWFSTTGFIGIIYIVQHLKSPISSIYLAGRILFIAVGYWGWTNFGVWLTSGMYSLSMEGLLQCYTMALPFLSYSILGDLVWSIIIFSLFKRSVFYKTSHII